MAEQFQSLKAGEKAGGSSLMSTVTIIHGLNDGSFDLPEGATVLGVRQSLADAFNLPQFALAFINGLKVVDDYQLRSRDVLEFVVSRGCKGADEPVPKLTFTQYDNIDITDGVPNGLIHVDIPRIGMTCKSLGIEYSKALVGWDTHGRRGRYKQSYPRFSGVVIRLSDHQRLMDALAEKAKKRARKVARLPILAALFTLNRRAKRCRDLAQNFYQNGMHGLAGDMKREKDRIYDLKGQILHHMVEGGTLVGGKFHRFEFGNWAEVLMGDGYRFHRPCPPQESVPETELIDSIEAKPKEASEPTLDIAYEVVEKFLKGKSRVTVYEWPPRDRSRRNYGRYGEDEDDDLDDDFDDDEEY